MLTVIKWKNSYGYKRVTANAKRQKTTNRITKEKNNYDN